MFEWTIGYIKEWKEMLQKQEKLFKVLYILETPITFSMMILSDIIDLLI